ncbi:MAG: DNA polymerase domain-containing protein [Candidatus Pacebacteria bacterium]|nr:DNA polymerase domain-containing protein [Candidatus Paceibacterota bacterium]
MRFYTYIGMMRNQIYVREFSGNEEHSYTENFQPTMFVPAPPEKCNYRTLKGKPVASMKFDDIATCRDFIKQYKGVAEFPVYGNPNYMIQYISEKFPKKFQWNMNKIRIYTIDIEVSAEDGFPNIQSAASDVTAITVHNSSTNEYHVWGTGGYVPHDQTKKIFYNECDDEDDLIENFLQWWETNYPHIITGWNCKFFDIPYLVNRITYLGKKPARLSPVGVLNDRNVVIAGRENQFYTLVGISTLDYIDLYKKFTYKVRESYRLDYIGSVELGMKKVSVEDVQGYDLYKTNYQKFIEYNIRDVEIVERLEEKMKLLELVITLAYESKINFEDVFSPVRTWDAIIYNFLKKKNIIIPQPAEQDDRKDIIGAYVKEPHAGLHKWVVSFDLNSLYPHLIQQYNISPETKCGMKDDITVDKLLDQKLDTTFLKENKQCMTPNGQCFTNEIKGFLPQLMEDMYNERVEFKKKMLQEQQKLEDGNYTNKQTVVNNISRCNNIQMSKKILLNSAYGALANQHFRYYSLEMAEGITTAGQLAIRWIDKSINTYINQLLNTENVDYVVASDTDSIYVTFDRLVHQVFTDTDDATKTTKIITFLDKISKDKIEPFINRSYEALHSYVNSYAQKMQMGREVIADKGIWTAKKRYILNVYDSEGVKYKEPKLKIMGIESVRSSTPEWCRNKIKDLIRIIINTDEETVMQSIADYREAFNNLSFDQLAFPRSVRGVEKYSSTKSIYSKGTPIHVRGVLLYNYLLKKHKLTKKYQSIREGEKIKFAYLKEPNTLRENVISVSTHLPKEFELEKYIDYDLQFDKAFLQPIKNILDVIGWKTEKQGSLESFF